MSDAGSISASHQEDVLRVLHERFGFESLRPGQEQVISDVLDGSKVIAVMPTGAGKSLCYQLPGVLLSENKGVSLVVSPLIALMKDQVDGLCERGIRAASLTSAVSSAEQAKILQGIGEGAYSLVYVAPERFHSSRFLSALREIKDRLALLAIDEAHCISEWGHEFRPAYRMLGEAIKQLQPPRLMAVTATATPSVRKDIAEQLGLRAPTMRVWGFARPEICFSVEHTSGAKSKGKRLVELLSELREGSALVYAATRKNAEKYAQQLRDAGLGAQAYHAGLEDQQRSAIQDQFMSGEVQIVVATNAFGMGVDKTDVRLVIHADLPRSLEAYYQEAGRAGRDGKAARCVLLFNHGDVQLQEFLINASYPSAALLRATWRALRERSAASVDDLAELELPGDPHESTLSTAVRILVRHGFAVDDMGALRACQPQELHGEFPEFDPERTERRAGVERDKLRQMIEYAYFAGCRHAFVLDYFGQERADDAERCQGCDNCLGTSAAENLSEKQVEQANALLQLVAQLDGRFGRRRLASIANGSDEDERFYGLAERGCCSGTSQRAVSDLLRSLEAAGLLKTSTGEYPTLKLSSAGKSIVRGQADIDPSLLRLMPTGGSKRKKSSTRPPAGDIDFDLLAKLRSLRTDIAREKSVPAYVIFSNRTLEDLCVRKPTTLGELEAVHGIGPSRIESYGERIIATISE